MIQYENGIINTTIACVCGILGGVTDYLIRHTTTLSIIGIFQAAFTALLCGAAGIAGKEIYIFAKKKIKEKNKRKK